MRFRLYRSQFPLLLDLLVVILLRSEVLQFHLVLAEYLQREVLHVP